VIGIVFAHLNEPPSLLFWTRQFILIIAGSSRAGDSFSNCAGGVEWMYLGGLVIWDVFTASRGAVFRGMVDATP
jgi:hypothetical protein